MTNLLTTIHATAAEIREGRRWCRDVVKSCLARIDEREGDVRAWVSVDREGALARAAELDAELKAGRDRGPLHGIPIGIKDIVDVAGRPTVAGYPPWEGNAPATKDADVVRRLREAGAVILGKTVTTQFAGFDPPVTRNPCNLAHTPGGSSSGSAAAVAAGMCLGAIGSQTGGSITRPASFCGIAACKPTFGRVSLDGILPLSPTLDHPGPMAGCVRDVAILLEAIIEGGAGLGDGGSGIGDRRPRIGRLRGFFEEWAEPEMNAALDHTLKGLSNAGAIVADVALPDSFQSIIADHRRLIAAGAANVHRERFRAAPDSFRPKIRELIEEGLTVPASELPLLHERQTVARREFVACLEGLDAAICPGSLGPAPDISTTGDPRFNAPWSFTGLPVVSFAVGRSAKGLPLCVQMVGRPLEEASLFRVATWVEDRCGK